MPTDKPRVQVTLEPETHRVIERFAYLQKRSRGSVIAEMINSVAPALSRTIALLEAAQEAPEQLKDGLRRVIESAHEEIAVAAGTGTRQLDELLAQISAADGGSTPVSVTRGSGTSTDTTPGSEKKRRKRSSKGVSDE